MACEDEGQTCEMGARGVGGMLGVWKGKYGMWDERGGGVWTPWLSGQGRDV